MKMPFLQDKNILIISPEPWHHLFISKHHYAIELGKTNRVFFLNPPSSGYAIRSTPYHNVHEIDYSSFVAGLRFLPPFVQRMFMQKKYRAIEKLAGVKFHAVWSFDNSVFFDFSFLPKDMLTISHIMDYSQDFQLARAASTASLCIGISKHVVDLLKAHNSNSFVLGHGIALDRARSAAVVLPGNNAVKAIFAGNLDRKHFDKNILLMLARQNPSVDFIFFGSGGKDWDRLPNAYYPGVVESALLPNYLEKADVLLLAYKVDEYPLELTNSHKVLEYLASGNVAVTSFLADYANEPGLLEMVPRAEDFPIVFGEVISNLARHNNAERKAVRKAFAQRHSYARRLEEIESFLARIG